jgi:hypothetical protein
MESGYIRMYDVAMEDKYEFILSREQDKIFVTALLHEGQKISSKNITLQQFFEIFDNIRHIFLMKQDPYSKIYPGWGLIIVVKQLGKIFKWQNIGPDGPAQKDPSKIPTLLEGYIYNQIITYLARSAKELFSQI